VVGVGQRNKRRDRKPDTNPGGRINKGKKNFSGVPG